MKYLILFVLMLCSAPAWCQYFISPTGSDSANGTSVSTPWLTPNHALTCGATISAAAGTYQEYNFQNGNWGTVTCPGNNNFAWLKCATFDGCKISNPYGGDAMWIDQSYWAVEGWEASSSGGVYGSCFVVRPSTSAAQVVHHVLFANNVANSCFGGGFQAVPYNGTSIMASVDYIAFVGNVAYNSVQGSGACYSGFNIFKPIALDNATGTHMFIAGNFSYGNVDPNPCAGTSPTDGEGINLDTWDSSQSPVGTPYTKQAYVLNNMLVGNGGRGVEVENNTGSAPIYIKYNTSYGNQTQASQEFCIDNGDTSFYKAYSVTASGNLVMTSSTFDCGGTGSYPLYTFAVSSSNSTNTVAGNWLYSASGHNTYTDGAGGFSYGTNATGTSPAFTSTTIPGAPSCSGTANVPDCMSAMVSGFTPTTLAAKSYGYQTPSNISVPDALFPTWLCSASGALNPNIPAGLITPGCGAASTLPSSGLTCRSGAPTGGLLGPGNSPPTQGLPCN